MPSGWEWLVILAFGLLLFGKRLPDVGKSLGRSIVEFKKGIKGIEDEIESESSKNARSASARKAELSEADRRAGLDAPRASQAEGSSAGISHGSPVEALR